MKKPVIIINGYFDLTFYKISGREIMNDKEIDEIVSKLQNREYLLGMESRTIKSIDDLDTVLYTFKKTPTTDVSYDFEIDEE